MTQRHTASVVICAYRDDRWSLLKSAVDSALAQVSDRDEVIVVIDHNEDLLRRATADLEEVDVVANRYGRGASGGRNTGIEHATRDIVVFLDDDATAASDWLASQLSWYDDPGVVAVGGAAHPAWEGGHRPTWLPPYFDWVLGCTYDGQPLTATPVRNVWACNMSVRRATIAVSGGFREDIGGVSSGVTRGCEETELCIRLGEHGQVIYEPRSAVSHFVPAERQSFGYFRRRCYQEGLSKSLVARAVGHRSATSSESAYARMVLSRIAAQVARGATRADLAAARQGVVALIGLAITTMGYVAWSAKLRSRGTRPR